MELTKIWLLPLMMLFLDISYKNSDDVRGLTMEPINSTIQI